MLDSEKLSGKGSAEKDTVRIAKNGVVLPRAVDASQLATCLDPKQFPSRLRGVSVISLGSSGNCNTQCRQNYVLILSRRRTKINHIQERLPNYQYSFRKALVIVDSILILVFSNLTILRVKLGWLTVVHLE